MHKARLTFAASGLLALAIATDASAFEFGAAPWAVAGGVIIGASAGTPPPGVYMFNQFAAYEANLTGPGNRLLNPTGTKTGVQVATVATGFLWVPGWTFLGADYNAVLVQPAQQSSVGSPVNAQAAGLHNTYIVPVELSWRLGDSGFFVKTGLGIDIPDGTMNGVTKIENLGKPWWTFHPEIAFSYLKDGWNLTAFLSGEINTENRVTGYTSGNIFHADFTATKTIGKWTFGPVGYYIGQVSNDKSSAFYGNAINVNRYNILAAGALVGYDFGPAALNVWATNEFYSNASGGNAGPPGVDTAAISKGFSLFASLSYRIWAPDPPAAAPRRPQFYK